MKWHYTLINADNTNVGETLDPTIQTTQRGVYKNDIDVTIKCHQRLGKEAIYIYICMYMTPDSKKRYKHTTDFTLIAQTELLVILF